MAGIFYGAGGGSAANAWTDKNAKIISSEEKTL